VHGWLGDNTRPRRVLCTVPVRVPSPSRGVCVFFCRCLVLTGCLCGGVGVLHAQCCTLYGRKRAIVSLSTPVRQSPTARWIVNVSLDVSANVQAPVAKTAIATRIFFQRA